MRILIADDHPLFLDAVKQRIARIFPEANILTATTSGELFSLLEGETADLVITDYSMPGSENLESIQKTVSCSRGAPVIIMSGIPSQIDVQACIQVGAKGFLPKTLSADIFAAAVSLIMSGGIYVPPEFMIACKDQSPSNPYDLSSKELDILQMIVDGASNKEIARAFDIEEVTVKFHLSRIFKKMDVKNRSQAAVLAVRSGIFT